MRKRRRSRNYHKRIPGKYELSRKIRKSVRGLRRAHRRSRGLNSAKPWWRKIYPTSKAKNFRGKMVPVYYAGIFRDRKGTKWKAYGSKITDMSAWVRLERKGHKAKMAYDPGGSLLRGIGRR